MLIERIWAANELRNFHYLIACAQTGEALVVDPLDARQCLAAARRHGFTITQILNTHEHLDHTAGNAEVVAATGAKVLAHAGAARHIGGVDRGLARGDVIKVGTYRGARDAGYARPHARACLPAGARRRAGAVLRRHAVQRRRRQLPQRRRSRPALRDLREPARQSTRCDARVSGARVHGAQPRVHAGSRARQCGGREGAGLRRGRTIRPRRASRRWARRSA